MNKASKILNRVLLVLTVVMFGGGAYVHLFDFEFAGVFSNKQANQLRDEQRKLGKKLYTKMACMTCHGPKGRAPEGDMFPRIAGQKESYLKQQLINIGNGTRDSGAASLMKDAMPRDFSDAQAEALAIYISELSP